jgi:hypothetical protein
MVVIIRSTIVIPFAIYLHAQVIQAELEDVLPK